MAKHTGITIRIGAAYDEVRVSHGGNKLLKDIVFDRSQMRKDGKPQLQGELRRTTVEVWASQREDAKGRGAQRHRNKGRDKARREGAQ